MEKFNQETTETNPRLKFRQEIGAEQEELLNLKELEFESEGGKHQIDLDPQVIEKVDQLFNPVIYKLTSEKGDLKGIWAEVTCPDCQEIKTFHDRFDGKKFGLDFQYPKLEQRNGKWLVMGNLSSRSNGSLEGWLINFYRYLENKGLANALHEQGLIDNQLYQKTRLRCPHCLAENA
jgi:hypothetical protein